eukprot:GHVN01021962.1.p1 GENE.GHVN01021962.1~~GHVN01021962.1.p1  ORF type:complete len:210 (+),score=34.82 GHVN01021962.1:709-1338(+)
MSFKDAGVQLWDSVQARQDQPTCPIIVGRNLGPVTDGPPIFPPASLRKRVMWHFHDSSFAAHLGRDKTVEKVKTRFTWPRLYNDVVPVRGNRTVHVQRLTPFVPTPWLRTESADPTLRTTTQSHHSLRQKPGRLSTALQSNHLRVFGRSNCPHIDIPREIESDVEIVLLDGGFEEEEPTVLIESDDNENEDSGEEEEQESDRREIRGWM